MRARRFDRELAALLALTFFFPVLLCLVFFPTPAIDLREHINWGLNFPLYTWKHPPLQSWLAGLVALTSIRDAWIYVLVAQVLNFIGLFYLVRTARDFIGEHTATPIVIAFCGSLYYSVAVPDTALNADQIQMPLWLGLLFHTLRATRDDRWVDWLACGLFAALAVLAKYFSIVFIVALGVAVLLTPSHRVVLRRPKFYVAVLVALAIASVHLVPQLLHLETLGYGYESIQPAGSLGRRIDWVAALFGSIVVFGLPLLVALVPLALRGHLRVDPAPRGDAARVLVLTAMILLAVLLLSVIATGFRFRTRYGNPMLPIVLLASFCLVRIDPHAVPRFLRTTLAIWGAIVVGVVGAAFFFPQVYLRDPAAEAAAAIRADWDQQFTCGPAYVMGEADCAHAVGLYFKRGVIGLSSGDVACAPWVDRARLRRLGAVIIYNSAEEAEGAFLEFAPPSEPTALSLPYRRTWNGPERTYHYRFVPPQDCHRG